MKATLALMVVLLIGAACGREKDTATPAETPRSDAGAAANPPASVAPQAPVPPQAEPPPAAKAEPGAKYLEVTLPAGTKFGVRLNDSVTADTSKVQDALDATVIQPIVINETEVVPAGAHIKGHVSRVKPAAASGGSLSLDFTTLEISGDPYPVSAQVVEAAPATKGAEAAKAGIPAGGEIVAGGKNDAFPKGSVLSLRLAKAVTVRVPKK